MNRRNLLAACAVVFVVVMALPTGPIPAPIATPHAHGQVYAQKLGGGTGGSATSRRSGRWSDAALWSTDRVPGARESVVVAPGHVVTYDLHSDVEIARLAIQGTVVFARDRHTRLDVGNVIVESGGYLEMGTSDNPIPSTVQAEIRVVVNPLAQCTGGAAFVEGDTGLWVMTGGRWESHGAPVRATWTKLVQTAARGTATVRVIDDITDWPIGGSVVVTPTDNGKRGGGQVATYPQFEERQVVSVRRFPGYSELQLSGALGYEHEGTASAAGEVALLSRSAVITAKYASDEMNGHTMYMAGAHGGISYTEFRGLGNLGCLGRYPVHFHLMGDTSRGMRVKGASIWKSDNAFVNVHGSNGVLIEDTVGYDTPGVGFYIGEPAPNPTVDTVLVGNLAARVVWRTGALIGQQRAAGFWIESLNSVLIGNVGVGSWGTGSNDSAFHLAEQTTQVTGFNPLLMVRNEGHSNNGAGMFNWKNGGPAFAVVDLRAWRNGFAGLNWGAYTNRMRLHRSRLYENGLFNLKTTIIGSTIVDSVLFGTTAHPTPTGLFIGGYFISNDPSTPAQVVRTTFSDHQVHVSQDHAVCSRGVEQNDPLSDDCSGSYFLFYRNQFTGGKAFDFGWHRNANSFFRTLYFSGTASPAILAEHFRLTRKDRPRPSASAYYYAPYDAWLDPLTGTGEYKAPPLATLTGLTDDATLTGTVAYQLTISSQAPVTRVDFYVDEKIVASKTSGPFTHTWSSAGWTRRYAHVYAAVTDAGGNTGYTQVIRLRR